MLVRGYVLGVKRAWKNYNTDGGVKLHVVENMGVFKLSFQNIKCLET